MACSTVAVLALLAACFCSAAGSATSSSSLRKSVFNSSKATTPLRLAGANCADPPSELPKYCCAGIVPDVNYVNTCECNLKWTTEECQCKGLLNKHPCHHCMVHLPATNKWTKTFSKKELYENCATCVEKCKGKLAKGDCSMYMSEIWDQHFPDGSPEEVICTSDYLKSNLMKEDYPLPLKRVLYEKPKLRADNDYHQPSDWDVKGVR
eukprot:gnl/TRDRNA2_/TRDRNA2_131166_c0_seq1.p1 gnl/TRDRNA2_/TRDRNA2_131166_c0~~gnl/TRDRNA2_/TRDRNA2_131166_c0_seq1.p1  ORF type:complete len:208 (+),score=49.29 gnl/TRDRNA2_/TRDRNA2_131166_c0_seq1:75-698(+)